MKRFGWIRGLIATAALFLLAMIWWSSNLIEADLKVVRKEIIRLQKETEMLSQKVRYGSMGPGQSAIVARPHIDPTYPNVLSDDPYMTQTLPAQLGKNFSPHGVRKEGMIGRPENLHPFNGFRDVSNLVGLCTPTLAQLHNGKFETFAPDLALKIEERPRADIPSVMEYWVHLRDDVYWHPLSQDHFPKDLELSSHFFDRHQVTAHDFKFYYDAVMNPYLAEPKAVSLRTYLSDIEAFEVIDDYTFVIRWKAYPIDSGYQVKYASLGLTGSLCPLPSFVYQYLADGQKILDDDDDPETYRTNSVWAQNFTHHWAKNVIVSCGPYLFDGMTDEGIYLKRNPDYYEPYAVLLEGASYKFKESFDALWQDFKVGNIDFCSLSPSQLAECENFLQSSEYKEQESKIESIDYIDRCFFYLGWNQATEYFQSEKVRQALTLAIDRRRIIEQNLNQMAISITGPFFPYSSAYDSSIQTWPYNPDQACRLLEAEGWSDHDGDGVRDKLIDGKSVPFRFRLCYFVKSLSTKVIAEYVATTLREIGIDCQPQGLDIADLSRQFDDKTFDAIFMGWKLGSPPDDPRQIWHSVGAFEKGSSNAIGFANGEVDAIIDQLSYEHDPENRVALYHRFHKIIHEENPYTFLYTPKVRLLYRDYVKNLFIPTQRQDLIPGADIPEPNLQVIWLSR